MNDMKNDRKRLLWLTMLFFSVFIICFGYFYSTLEKNPYLGIRAHYIDNEWKVKRILLESAAQENNIKNGDIILLIDKHPAQENEILNNWLIVEQAKSVTLMRDGEKIEVFFQKNHTAFHRFLIFSLISILGLLVLFRYAMKQNNSKSSAYFYSFFLITLFALLAVIPSSIGNILGRLIIVLYVSLFPIYLNLFLFNKNEMYYKPNKLQHILLFITIFNIIICLATLFVNLPNMLAEYLSQGIFYTLGFLLLFLLLRNIFYKRTKESNSKLNLSLISILSFAPLFFCYILPNKWEVPFFLVIPFLLLPVLCVFHLLTLSRLIFNKYRISSIVLYFILSISISGLFLLILLLTDYVSIQILFLYSFLLIYSLIPFIEELLFTMKKRTDHESSLALFSAVENERENISLYIHDTVIQEVIYFMKDTKKKGELIPKKEVLYSLDEIVFYLRELCSNIYPLMIQEIGLENTLKSMISQLEKKHPVIISYSFQKKDLKLSLKKSNFVLRSIRELNLLVEQIDDNYCFSVKDNGKFKPSTANTNLHFGLEVIKEKLDLLNGGIHIDTYQGTSITLEVPLDE